MRRQTALVDEDASDSTLRVAIHERR